MAHPSESPSPFTPGSITALFHGLRSGESSAAKELWLRFFPRLLSIARKALAGRELPMGAEDAVQKAFMQFFENVRAGKVDAHNRRDELWRILSVMTVQMARKLERGERTQKRGLGKVRRETDLLDCAENGQHLDELLSQIAPPDADLICEELLSALDDDLREVAILRLSGYSVAEIKEITTFPIRSIERRLQLIRSIWLDRISE